MHRPLTPNEIALASSIFGDSIDYTRVRIVKAWWVLPNYAISPNGNIYFNKQNYRSDFAEASLGIRAWWLHEMTHVWQFQQGIKVLIKALVNRRYSYVITEGKAFYKYGLEQQAQMVQDFYIQKHSQQDCSALAQCLPWEV